MISRITAIGDIKRISLFVTAMSMAAVFLWAQDTNYADYYRGRYAQIYKAYAENPGDVAALVAMADFYSQKNNPMRNLPMAMKYAARAEKNYMALVEDRSSYKEVSRLVRDKVTVASVRQLKQAILEETRRYMAASSALPESELTMLKEVFADDAVIMREVERYRYNQEFDQARNSASLPGWYRFLMRHSGTAGAEYAEKEISRLVGELFADISEERFVDSVMRPYSDCEYIMLMAMRQKSRIAYARACEENTASGYRRFLRQYPRSDEYSQALERMQTLLTAEFRALLTAREYADFALRNPDDTLADIAVRRLSSMVLKRRDRQALKIYMDNFPLDSLHDYIYRQSYEWCADEGNSQPIADFLRQNPDCPFAPKAAADLHRAAAIDTVDLGRRVSENDVARYAAYTRLLMGRRISYVALLRSAQPFIAAHNWKRALQQVKSLSLVFEDYYNDLYKDLVTILSTDNPDAKNPAAELTLTGYDVLHPWVTADGKGMYYTRRDAAGRKEVCFSARSGGAWQAGTPVNIEDRGSAVGEDDSRGWEFFGLFADDTKMLLGRGGDIAVATLETDTTRHQGIRKSNYWRITEVPPYPVNTDYIETDAYMLPDGTGLLLASDRPYGHNYQTSGTNFHGDTALATDLYFIPRTDMGWGAAVNLGITVNTPYCELSPVLSRDMLTLYFISDQAGLGYGDIYVTRRPTASTWTRWSPPVNLGRQVNSPFHEGSVSLSEDERKLYYTTAPQGLRQSCRSITLSTTPAEYYRNVGINLSSLKDRAQMAQVEVVDCEAGLVMHKFATDDFTQPLQLRLHKDKNYLVHVRAGNLYAPACPLPQGSAGGTVNVKAYSRANVETDSILTTMHGVAFDSASISLMPWSRREINALAEFLCRNTSCHAELIVHVRGDDDDLCYQLSLERGRELKKRLVERGVLPSAVSVSAYGNVMYKGGRRPKSPVMLRLY